MELSGAESVSLARELTADRFGLLAGHDLDAALRLQMISVTGGVGSAIEWDTRAYLTECQKIVRDVLAEGGFSVGVTHPEHNLRAYAVLLFSESEVYRDLTGHGPGTRRLAEIDADLARLLPIRVLRRRVTGRSPPLTRPAPASPDPAGASPDVLRFGEALRDLRAQMGKAVHEIGARVSAILSPSTPGDPEPPVDHGTVEEDDLEKRFATLERRMKERDEKSLRK
jgi:hypothetical protein